MIWLNESFLYSDFNLLQDVQWDDMDYAIDNLDFTYDRAKFGDVPGLAKQLHAKGMHYMMNFVSTPLIYS